MRILHVAPAFFPATYWGGPIFSLHGLCNALAAHDGVELRVLSSDTAGPDITDRIATTGFPVRFPAGYDVYYCRRTHGVEISPSLVWHLFPMVRWADVVHVTATYSFPTIPTLLACKMLDKPLVWSPRGALKATADWDSVRKRKLKRIWEIVCSACMPARCLLHVTSEAEKLTSLARLREAQATVIPNGVDIPTMVSSREWIPGGVLRLMYLGRLHPIKGIENLLCAIRALKDRNFSLTLYGAGEPSYVDELREQIAKLGLGTHVQLAGRVDGPDKSKAFVDADVCVVPSFSENFSMVVAEALAHGVPVIASTGTPWESLEERNCGLWVPNDPQSLAHAISRTRGMDLEEMGKRGRAWMSEKFGWASIASQMLRMYEGLYLRD